MIDEKTKRQCLELLIEQNPMLDKDSILALYNDILSHINTTYSNSSLKEIILQHKY